MSTKANVIDNARAFGDLRLLTEMFLCGLLAHSRCPVSHAAHPCRRYRASKPDFKFPVYWLYIGDKDVLHLTQGGANVSANRMKYLGQQSQVTEGSGVVDHVGFRAHGLEDTIAHLSRLGIKFTERQVDDQGLYQLFLFDPNGVKVELNFSASEVKGRKATVVASELSDAPN